MHLKMINSEGKLDRGSQYIKDKHINLLRRIQPIRERWAWWIHALLNTKSPKLDPNVTEDLDQCLENTPLELIDYLRSLSNGNARMAEWRSRHRPQR